MSLWYAQNRRRKPDTGKFRSQARPGTEKSSGGRHGGWSYHFVSHQAGTSVSRVTYSVSILDRSGNRAGYLRDFSSIERATGAAHAWIDQRTKRVTPAAAVPKTIGTVPTLPMADNAQQK